MIAAAAGARRSPAPHRSEEPEWLAELRSFASARARELPFPTGREESWRFTEVSLLDPGRFARGSLESNSRNRTGTTLPRAPELEEGLRPSARIDLVDGSVTREETGDEAARSGVLLLELGNAARREGDLVKGHLGTLARPEDLFSSRSLAGFEGGTLLRVPDGVRLEAPILTTSSILAHGGEATTRNLVVLGADAEANLDDWVLAPAREEPTLASTTTEIFLGEGAHLRLVALQELGRGVVHLGSFRARLARGARLEILVASLGADLSRTSTEVVLEGEGAESLLLGAAAPRGREQVEHHTLQDHAVPQTTSDLLYKGAAQGRATSIYLGTVRVRPGARGTSAYQASRNLLLSEEARIETNPRLEIENNDVRCTHGATVGPLDEEQRFYLTSRGIPGPEADRLLLEGFFEDLGARIPGSSLRGRLREAILLRFGEPG